MTQLKIFSLPSYCTSSSCNSWWDELIFERSLFTISEKFIQPDGIMKKIVIFELFICFRREWCLILVSFSSVVFSVEQKTFKKDLLQLLFIYLSHSVGLNGFISHYSYFFAEDWEPQKWRDQWFHSTKNMSSKKYWNRNL